MTALPSPSGNWFAQFGIDAALCRRVLAEAARHGADDADLFFEHAISTSVALTDHKVNRAHLSVDLGVGIRVVIGDQVGHAYTEDLDVDSMLRTARLAAQIARGGRSIDPVEATPVHYQNHYPPASEVFDTSVEARVPLVRAWEQQAFALDPRIQNVQTSLGDAERHVMIVTLDGRVAADWRPMTRAAVMVTATDGELREGGAYAIAGRMGLEFYTPERQRRLVREAVERATLALHAGKPPAGEMTVVLAAGSAGILLHEAIGHGMEADFARKGITIFADRIGQRVAPPGVTIVDDATVPYARGALNVDDEGSATERTVLVEDGILRSFLHDRISARHYGIASTGSGRRESFRHAVLPRMRCTYMDPGRYAPEEIIGSVERGIWCDTFGNGQVAIGAGDFAFYVRSGRLIENGKLTRHVKDINVVGNGPKVLETIDMVGTDLAIDEGGWTCGKDGQSVPVSQGMPTVRVAKLSVGGATR